MENTTERKVYFISHAPAQRAFAYAIAYIFRQRGQVVILYEFNFPEDVDFVQEISDALVDADVVICLLSPEFIDSNWCVKEFTLAHKAHKLVPVYIESCDIKRLPPLDALIDLRAKGEKDAIATFEQEIDAFVEKLTPLPLTYDEAFAFIEKCVIVLPLFAGGEGSRPEFWQIHAHQFTVNIFQDQNVEVIQVPEAIKVLKDLPADIVLYGTHNDDYTEIGFVSSRGWNLKTYDDLKLPDDLKFETRGENFHDLSCVLKVAFGNLEQARNRYEKAATCFTEAIEGVAPERAYNMGMQYMYEHRAQLHTSLKQYQEAIADYTEAIQLDPQFAIAYNNRGVAYTDLRQPYNAIADFTQGIKINPRIAEFYCNRGAVYDSLGQSDQAIADHNDAIRLNPMYAPAYHYRGGAYHNRGQYQEAIADLTDAVRLDPQFAQAYHSRGSVYEFLKMWCEALRDFQIYVDLKNSNDLNLQAKITNLLELCGTS